MISAMVAGLLLCSASIVAFATVQIDTEKDASLTISHLYNGAAIASADFYLYQVADVSAEGDYTLTDKFSELSIDFSAVDTNEALQNAAESAEQYVGDIGVAHDYTGITDSNGTCVFDGLAVGVYLVLAEEYVETASSGAKTYYYGEPVLVYIPQLSEASDTGEWTSVYVYTIQMVSKVSTLVVEPTPTPTATVTPTPTPTSDGWIVITTPSVTPATGVLGDSIVKTGVVTWPITVFGSIGCLCILFGLLLKKRGRE